LHDSFDYFEQQYDAVAVQIAEASFADVKDQDEAHAEVEEVEYSARNLRYEDAVEEATPEIVVEEAPALVQSTKDSHAAKAFKCVLNELLTRRNHSNVSAVNSTSLPSVADFTADVYLAAKRSLHPRLYEIFCWTVETEFEEWRDVSLLDRREIMNKTGAALIERGVCDKRGRTRAYFFSGYKERGYALAKAA
jgi:hypothetical protein